MRRAEYGFVYCDWDLIEILFNTDQEVSSLRSLFSKINVCGYNLLQPYEQGRIIV